jgi:hypothetical protein
MPRTYADVWSDVRANMKLLIGLAQRRGYRDGTQNVLFDTAQLGLIRGDDDEAIGVGVAEALVADEPYRDWRQGYLLTCWDIVHVAEALHIRFAPAPDLGTGAFFMDLESLVADLREARRVSAIRAQVPALIEAELAKARDLRDGPAALHRRITANGLIIPPAPGTKYRPLFDEIDGRRRAFDLDRERIEELFRKGVTKGKRNVRGAKGREGPAVRAISDKTWWYGPWNADKPNDLIIADGSLKKRLSDKSWARAWLASGMQAAPRMSHGELDSVTFTPVRDREDWWGWRQHLRDGTFQKTVQT